MKIEASHKYQAKIEVRAMNFKISPGYMGVLIGDLMHLSDKYGINFIPTDFHIDGQMTDDIKLGRFDFKTK